MAETLLLRYQASDEAPQHLQNVTGIELPDGTSFRGYMHDASRPEAEMALEWRPDISENVAAFYEGHLTSPDPDRMREGWNCHSFVAAAMGWEVCWSVGATPYFMPRGFRLIQPDQLQDQQPYANTSWGDALQHSFIGLPRWSQTLAVWAFRQPLCIANTVYTCQRYGEQIREHRPPRSRHVALGRLAARVLPFCDDKMPKELWQPARAVPC